MFTFNVDLGQVLLGLMMGAVGFFIKRMIDRFEKRIDEHQNILFRMNGDIQSILGKLDTDRRRSSRN